MGHQVGVESTGGHQFAVIAGLDQPAFIEDQDPVGVDDAGKTVRDPQGGAACYEPVQGLDNNRLVFRVNTGQGLVKDEDGRILEQGTGDGDALFLSSGESHGPLAYDSVVPVG